MPSRKLLWQLLPSYTFVVLIAVTAMAVYSVVQLHRSLRRESLHQLRQQADILALHLAYHLDPLEKADVQALCEQYNQPENRWFSVTLPDGTVYCAKPELIENGRLPFGAAEALNGETLLRWVPRAENDHYRMAAAIPIYAADNRLLGALTLHEAYRGAGLIPDGIIAKMLAVAFITMMLAVITGMVMALRISAPLEHIRAAAERFAHGDFSYRIPEYPSRELGQLALTMNGMAKRLSDTLTILNRQRSEQNAMLASMTEGVIAIDSKEQVLNINAAAAALLNIKAENARGHAIQEVIRNAALQEFLITALSVQDAPLERNIVLYGTPLRYLLARASRMKDRQGYTIGALIVLHDVTEVQRLERIRRDFVANVSHELKTPITSIKGFAETLLQSPDSDPEESRRYLEIIERQTDRLDSIINDLLLLSRMEQDRERESVSFQDEAVRPIIENAVQVCRMNADAKQIHLEVYANPDLRAVVNGHLVEQALVNLIDNAVKYSDEHKTVRVEAEPTEGDISIRVIDEGCGIEKKHIPRLFERFYRVDKARSRKMGGTGLGLAIVKHIINAHNGQVHVESSPGHGTTFTISFPAHPAERQAETQVEMAFDRNNPESRVENEKT